MNKAPAKKSPVKKQSPSSTAKSAQTKVTATKVAAKKALAPKLPAKKASAKKAPAPKRAPASKPPASKAPGAKAPVTKAPVTKSTATKATAKRADSTTPKRAGATVKAPSAKATATKAVAAKTAPGRGTTSRGGGTTAAPVVDRPPAKVAVEKKAPPVKKPSPGYRKDTAFLDRQREALLEERAGRLAQEQSQKQEAAALVEEMEPGDIQFDEESGEGGTLAVDREIHLELAAKQRLLVEEIDLALRKIALGTYGICERCENLIPKTRLTAIPEARICVPCSAGGLSRR